MHPISRNLAERLALDKYRFFFFFFFSTFVSPFEVIFNSASRAEPHSAIYLGTSRRPARVSASCLGRFSFHRVAPSRCTSKTGSSLASALGQNPPPSPSSKSLPLLVWAAQDGDSYSFLLSFFSVLAARTIHSISTWIPSHSHTVLRILPHHHHYHPHPPPSRLSSLPIRSLHQPHEPPPQFAPPCAADNDDDAAAAVPVHCRNSAKQRRTQKGGGASISLQRLINKLVISRADWENKAALASWPHWPAPPALPPFATTQGPLPPRNDLGVSTMRHPRY